MWLALVPIGVAIFLGVLLVPRAAVPEWIPLPQVDIVQIARSMAADHALAEAARHDPLPISVRALGSALRAFHSLEAPGDADAAALAEARHGVDAALIAALDGGDRPLLELRAVQLEAFLEEVRRLEATGEPSPELYALAGSFLRTMKSEGWYEGSTLVPSETELRTMYKQMWNAFLGLERRSGFEPTLDEWRAAYAFYLAHPHLPRGVRASLDAARHGARDTKSCRAIALAERAAIAASRLQRVRTLAAIDPTYPADFAVGVASYGHGDYAASADAFRRWLHDHPDGPLALRAQNHLRAAIDAERVE
jgi:hypothetical protein